MQVLIGVVAGVVIGAVAVVWALGSVVAMLLEESAANGRAQT